MGNSCSAIDCTVDIDFTTNEVSSLGNVSFGEFQSNPDIAGIGTVVSLIVPTAIGALVSLIIVISLIIDRIPRASKFLEDHPAFGNIVPSPHQRPRRFLESPPGRSATPYDTPPLQYTDSVPLAPVQNLSYLQSPPNPSKYPQQYSQQIYSPPQQLHSEEWPSATQQPRSPTPPPPSSVKSDPPIDYKERNQPSEKLYDILEAILFSIPDSQILLAVALIFSFTLGDKCSFSQYHLDIAVNLSLIGCTNFVLAFTLVRNYWEAPLAAVVRILLFTAVLAFLGLVFQQQWSVGITPEQLPPTSRRDSLVLLRADCFLNITYANEFANLTANESDIIGSVHPDRNPFSTLEGSTYVILVAMSVLSLIVRVYQLVKFRTNGPPRKKRDPYSDDENTSPTLTSWLYFVWWGLTWLACVVLYGFMAYYIFNLRAWVAQSGWIQPDSLSSNPENYVQSFGQMSAMFTIGTTFLVGLDRWRPKRDSAE